jgi:hypothetical protein
METTRKSNGKVASMLRRVDSRWSDLFKNKAVYRGEPR